MFHHLTDSLISELSNFSAPHYRTLLKSSTGFFCQPTFSSSSNNAPMLHINHLTTPLKLNSRLWDNSKPSAGLPVAACCAFANKETPDSCSCLQESARFPSKSREHGALTLAHDQKLPPRFRVRPQILWAPLRARAHVLKPLYHGSLQKEHAVVSHSAPPSKPSSAPSTSGELTDTSARGRGLRKPRTWVN